MALVFEGSSGKISSGEGPGNSDRATQRWTWQRGSGGPSDQPLEPRVPPQRIERRTDPEPARREKVGILSSGSSVSSAFSCSPRRMYARAIVHGEDVRVLQPGGQPDLPLEALGAQGG